MANDSGRSADIYGSDDHGAAEAIDTKLGGGDHELDVHGASDSRAKSEGNHGKD